MDGEKENQLMKMENKGMGSGDYRCLLSEISGIISNGRAVALRQIDTTQVITYWLVGRRIVEFYQHGKDRAEYGEQILIKLSRDLNARFGKGYSVDNLENMRKFYTEFPKLFKISETLSRKSIVAESWQKSETASRILSWSHYCELHVRCDIGPSGQSHSCLSFPHRRESSMLPFVGVSLGGTLTFKYSASFVVHSKILR